MIVSEEDIYIIVNKLKSIINVQDTIVLLRGTLAAGKTTFVRNYIKSIGISKPVTSPTFSIQTIYENKIFHYDLYNKTLEQFVALGLLEEFEKSGIHFVEWGDEILENILNEYGFNTIVINITKKENKREYIIES